MSERGSNGITTRETAFLRTGETCWRSDEAARAALLIDASTYFGALRESLLRAERSILLVGWDIDSRAPIRGDTEPDDGAPLTLGPLLSWLVGQRRRLVVRVLLWDYSMLYSLERQPLPRLNLDWKLPRRVKVCLDNKLPFGASHHEKLAVIDGKLAYCGGIDLTIRRWDRPAHARDDADRRDPDGEAYAPFHDLQMVVDGAAARSLAELAVARWNRAAGARARFPATEGDPWPAGVEPDFREVAVGIARTVPAYAGDTERREVIAAYLAAIGRARRLLYIENQYLTVLRIARALCERLAACPDLEVIIINPEKPSGWLEEQTMGQGRIRFLERLAASGLADRVRVLYPWVGGAGARTPVMVHAKLMIVDDRLLHVGSSNLNRRSMGVDRECDLLIEASDSAQRATIARLRSQLLAHHLGIPLDELESSLADDSPLIPWLDARESHQRGLAAITVDASAASDDGLATELVVELADPESPVEPERFIGDLFGAIAGHPLRRRALRLLQLAGLLAVLIAVWRFTPLADWADPQRIGTALERVAASRWAGPLMLVCFVIGSFVLFPVTVLIAAAAVVLGPVAGFCYAWSGAVLAAMLNFGAGRLLPERMLEAWFGGWIGGVQQRLNRGGIVAIMLVRNLPIAPFSVVNFLAGAARIRTLDFLLGTTLGMAPGVAALTILGDRLRGVWQDPGWLNLSLLGGALLLWIGVAVGLQSLSNRLANAR